ncbi:phosphatase PAP2 family protein [Candidatus Parcubacteria bacterium]|jgi:undecaprenyl-diphosphatase|nr:phosphatase PAP2 family protein [Candidatus Parcubacteria bacterium]MBT3948457.1 phosphatase PAP2 family protein [Candidatus Parcubacteria bacterium]
MKLSWSHKLFLKINSNIGKSRFFDALMYFCAIFLIYILGLTVLGWGAFVLFDKSPDQFALLIKLLFTAHLFGFGISYVVAILWKHPRPIARFPDIKRMFKAVDTWKSFPSDHTMISYLLTFVAIMVGIPLWFGIVLVILSFIIGSARVYCGVHYPRDILGGVVWAGIIALASPWLLENITQPIYNLVKAFF